MFRAICSSLAIFSILAFESLVPSSVCGVEKAFKPVQECKGKFVDDEDERLINEAPENGYVTDEKSWGRLWKAWRGKEELPNVDFEKQLVLVGTAECADNTIAADFDLSGDGDLNGGFLATEIGGPGFAYLIVVVDRSHIKTYCGHAILRENQKSAEDGKKLAAIDAQALLEKGQASGSLPEGLVIRLGACLGAPGRKDSNVEDSEDLPPETRETWEFTSRQVHRVVSEYKNNKSIHRRVESRPFDSKEICKELLEGKAIEIQARKGEGPEVAFVGTNYNLGYRSIEVVWNGETILNLYETRAATLRLYRESDGRAFGALYERLAKQARVLFKSTTVESR